MKQVQFPCFKCNAGTQELFMEGEEQPIHSYFICRCDETEDENKPTITFTPKYAESVEYHKTTPLNKKSKLPFGQGLFIRKDDFGNDCCVGDRVEVIRPEMSIPHEDWRGEETWKEISEQTFTGTLVLLKSRGVRIKLNTGLGTEYIKPPITNRSRNIWK